MKAIKIDVVKKEVTEIEINGDIKSMYEALECDFIEGITLIEREEKLWIDEEGLLRDEPLGAFRMLGYPQVLSGHGLVLGITSSGENRGTWLEVDQIKRLVEFVGLDEIPEPSFTVTTFD